MRRHLSVVSSLWLGTLLAAGSAARGGETRFFHDPDLSRDKIVFVHGGDLWTAPLSGGKAARLTFLPETESRPKFSPDGAWIAFSAVSDGNVDAYVVESHGGTPRRLTWHPSADQVQGWSPDATRVLFASDRASDHFRSQLMTIAASGGHPEVFPMHKAFRGAYSADGRRLAFTPMEDCFGTWKRYRGGGTTPIWLVDLRDYSHVEIPHENASDTAPVWLGDSVFFLSDRNDVMSVFRYDVATGVVEPVVDNGIIDIDSLSASHGRLVYASGGYVFTYDIASRRARRVPITVEHDLVESQAGSRKVADLIRAATLSPDGSKVLFEIRGELVAMTMGGGSFSNLTRSPGSAERHPAWSPDGKSIAYFSDVDGEYALYVRDAESSEPPTRIGAGRPGYFYRPVWSPDGRKIAYVDKLRSLWWVDVQSRNHTRMESLVHPEDPFVWTPDSQGIVYAHSKPTFFRGLTLYTLQSGRSRPITDAMGEAHQPAFSHDGRYLFFLGSTNVGQVKTGLDLSVMVHENEVTWSVFALLLRAGEPSPFALPPESHSPMSTPAEPGPGSFRADWDGCKDRIVRLPLPPGRYVELRAGADGALFLREDPSEKTFAGEPRLRRFDWQQRQAVDYLANVSAFEVSENGKMLLYRSERTWGVVPTSGAPVESAGTLDVSGVEIHVDPSLEWRQMYAEVWRKFRDFFYDDRMHGLDWEAIRERYKPYLAEVRHRSDLDYVFRNLAGEIVNSHIVVRGPETATPERVGVGLLGADFEVSEGHYRVKRIVPSTHWDEESSPLTVPGVDVKEGEWILEVNGQEIRHPTSLYSLLVGTVGKPVTLRVGLTPQPEGSRLVTVVPIESERLLRRRAWIERNRKRVDELSGGTIAYLYQPDTGIDSIREFDRMFFPQSDRAAVIIDERFNDGGDDPDYQLDVLDRQQVHWYARRDLPPFKSPFSIVAGPKVMLVNAEAGSGGDVYPYQFTLRKLGTTVGTRTWGGVNGGSGGPGLVDGGIVRVPDIGTYAPDGSFILENTGFTPDVEVQIFPKDDFEGRDPQLDRAIEILMDTLRKNPPEEVPRLEKVHRTLVPMPPRQN